MHDQCIIYENGRFLVGMIFVTLMPHCWESLDIWPRTVMS